MFLTDLGKNLTACATVNKSIIEIEIWLFRMVWLKNFLKLVDYKQQVTKHSIVDKDAE